MEGDSVRAAQAVRGGAPQPGSDSDLRFRVVLSVIVLAFLGAHLPLISTPYFQDELYYVPHALEVFGSSSPARALLGGQGDKTTGLELFLSAAWALFGYSVWITRWAMTAVSALCIVLTALLGRRLGGENCGLAAALLLAACPAFFLHGATAVPEAVVTAALSAALLAAAYRKPAAAACFLTIAVLTKPSALIAAPPVAWSFLEPGFLRQASRASRAVRQASWTLLLPLLALVSFCALRWLLLGGGAFSSGEMALAGRGLTVRGVAVRAVVRAYQLLVGDYRWVASLFLAYGLWTASREPGVGSEGGQVGARRHLLVSLAGLLLVYVAVHSFAGHWALMRYLVPALPGFSCLAAYGIARAFESRIVTAGVTAGIALLFVLAMFHGTNVSKYTIFAHNDHLGYLEVVSAYQQAVREVDAKSSISVVGANFPAEIMLSDARLGYTAKAYRIAALPVDRAGFEGSSTDALVFGRQLTAVPLPLWLKSGGCRPAFVTGIQGEDVKIVLRKQCEPRTLGVP
jgi:Dolichyl-phosphate-mannose-protein mannosyltransferase